MSDLEKSARMKAPVEATAYQVPGAREAIAERRQQAPGDADSAERVVDSL